MSTECAWEKPGFLFCLSPEKGLQMGREGSLELLQSSAALALGSMPGQQGRIGCHGEDCRSVGPVCFQQGLGPFIHDDSSCQGVICVEMSRT